MTQPALDVNQNIQTVESGIKDLDSLKSDLLQNYLNGSLILGTLVFFINLYISVQQHNTFSILATIVLFGILFLATFVHKADSVVRSVLLSVAFFGTGVFSLISNGLNANGMLYFFIAILILGLLLSRTWWIIGMVFTGITTLLIGILIKTNVIRSGVFIVESNSIIYWITTSVILLFLIYLILSPTNRYLLNTIRLLQSTRDDELSLKYDNSIISDRVHAMENELDRRRSHLISARQIIRSLSEKMNSADLMQDAVDLIKSQFGYYFAGIYLTDSSNENIILNAGTGAAGKAMLSRGHKIRISEGIIGFVISRGEPRTALDIDADILHSKNPDLPATKSEITIPLKIGNRVIGALDVQSDKLNSFSQDDSDILQTMADQIAILVEKTRQNEDLQASLSELEGAYSAYSQTSWRAHLQGSRNTLSYQYSGSSLEKKTIIDPQEIEAIQNSKKMVTNNEDPDASNPVATLAMPIMLRDQALGVINLKYHGKSVPKDLEEMVEITSSRLAVALENARLLEDIQDRADRERVVGSIASKVRSARDINSILQTTAAELGRSLGVNEVRIQLKTQENEQ